jgi:hypothetical protein
MGQFEHRTAAVTRAVGQITAELGGAIERSRRIHGQTCHGRCSITAAGESVKYGESLGVQALY